MRRVALVVSLLALGIGGPIRAASLAGVELPDKETVNGKTLVLNGMGLRQATVLRVTGGSGSQENLLSPSVSVGIPLVRASSLG